jgi:hypothetical protein
MAFPDPGAIHGLKEVLIPGCPGNIPGVFDTAYGLAA